MSISFDATSYETEFLTIEFPPRSSEIASIIPEPLKDITSFFEQGMVGQFFLEAEYLWVQLFNNRMLYISSEFEQLFPNLLMLCKYLITIIHFNLYSNNIPISKYVLDVYDLGEESFSIPTPYLEIFIQVSDEEELLRIWENTISFIREVFGDDILDHIDIFFSRV